LLEHAQHDRREHQDGSDFHVHSPSRAGVARRRWMLRNANTPVRADAPNGSRPAASRCRARSRRYSYTSSSLAPASAASAA
jgi:hypothetical protein